MASRFLAFAVAIALLLAFATFVMAFTASNAYAAGTWYVGDGVKKGMWMQYQIQQLDTANDQPFTMTLWFKDQDSKGNWIVPATVQYQGQTMNGTMRLGQNMAPLGGGQIPPNMAQFVDGYKNSLQWLDAFATKSAPQSLTALFWGRIASIGGAPVAPAGTEKVSFAGAKDLCGAPQCDTTLILWHKSLDNKVWVYPAFPFPVKADTFAEVASGQAPTQYKFELLATGMGQPPVFATSAIPLPPVTASTASGSYVVKLDWQPTNITAGSNVTFGLTFSDKSGFPLQNVDYNFNVTDASGKSIANLKDQRSASGTADHSVKIDMAGPISVIVTVNSVAGQTQQSGIIDQATFTTVAVPEFPTAAVLVVTAIIGVVVVMTRVKKIGLGGLFGSENTSAI